MANGWSVVFGLVVVVGLSACAWFFSPKGETQTIWRSSLILAFASCYIMWAITFLAQLNPLVAPRRDDWRKDYMPE